MRQPFTRSKSGLTVTASLAAIALMQALPAAAQTSDPQDDAVVAVPQERETVTQDTEIVVTGSRIRGPNTYNSTSPIDVITRDDAIMSGARSTAEILQGPTVTSGSAQINNTFLGYVSEGGPGANTVGLRGLGSQRTLVLLNGRRLAPAGAGPQLVSADLNVLPSAVVQRIEILREGASSVYGSDAVAGVINIITDNRFNGLTLDAFTDQPIEHGGGGRTYRLSAVAGKTFDRGHITASVEYRETTGLLVGSRDSFSCPTDNFYDPKTGAYEGQLTPDGKPRCFPFNNGVGTAQNYLLGINYTTGAINRYAYNNGDINSISVVNDPNSRPLANARQLDEHIYSPVRTYTGYLNGAYELADDLEIYGEALYSRRESHQNFMSQLSFDPAVLGRETYGGSYNGTPLSAYGYPTNPFFPESFAAAGNNVARVFIIPPIQQTRQKIDFFRANAGLRGNVGVGDLRFDANFQYSRTDATYSVGGVDVRRLRNALGIDVNDPTVSTIVLAPAGTPDAFVTVARPGTAGAGNRYTCASNVSNGAFIAGSNCVVGDFFNPDALAGNLAPNLVNYLYQNFESTTKFEQITGQLVVDGSIMPLQGGPLAFAVGVEFRRDEILDTPSEVQRTGNIYNYSSGNITAGSDQVTEVFGELRVPLLKDVPFADELSATASLRYTDYQSYGSDLTYRLGATWAPIEAIRIRGNYGTSFRAPNLYEQFVGDQTGFLSADPCDDFANLTTPGSNVYKNCLADLTAALGTPQAALGYISTGGYEVTTVGGRGVLEAETSTSWGLGLILTAPKEFANFSFAVDYFNIEVKGEVTTLGSTILDLCYESDDFRNGNRYCSFVGERETTQGGLTTLRDPYINVSKQQVEGIDFSARFQRDIGPGQLLLNARATRILHQKNQRFADEEAFDYAGLLGYQGFAGGPKWTGDIDARYVWNDVTLRWGVDYIGPMDSNSAFAGENGIDPIDPSVDHFDLRSNEYFRHDASIQFRWDKVGQVTLGVSNVFNVLPDTISTHTDGSAQFPRIGNYFNYSGYDFLGRSLFINVTRTF
ncbi:TonB-dependent receptor [Sphingomonas sp. HF-S3]|uniref:TonB-dependent receptor n=1 Tax=Sphingomonas rustica TaxID=3103142 RepID=A0ABV0B7I6_9SPHN